MPMVIVTLCRYALRHDRELLFKLFLRVLLTRLLGIPKAPRTIYWPDFASGGRLLTAVYIDDSGIAAVESGGNLI